MGLLKQLLAHQKKMEKRIHVIVAEIRDGKRARTKQVELAKVLPASMVGSAEAVVENEESQLRPETRPKVEPESMGAKIRDHCCQSEPWRPPSQERYVTKPLCSKATSREESQLKS